MIFQKKNLNPASFVKCTLHFKTALLENKKWLEIQIFILGDFPISIHNINMCKQSYRHSYWVNTTLLHGMIHRVYGLVPRSLLSHSYEDPKRENSETAWSHTVANFHFPVQKLWSVSFLAADSEGCFSVIRPYKNVQRAAQDTLTAKEGNQEAHSIRIHACTLRTKPTRVANLWFSIKLMLKWWIHHV